MILYRSIQTRFRFGSETVSLNLASHRNSPARSTKSTTSHACGALSACKHTVSGSFSLPSRGSFHRSLTVLFAIGHQVVFSLRRWSSHIHTGFHVSCATLELPRGKIDFDYGTVTLFCLTFQKCSSIYLCLPYWGPNPCFVSETGLGCCNFARHYFRNR